MKWLKKISLAGSSLIIYLCTLLGVLLAQFGPMLATNAPVSLKTYGWFRLCISAGIAFYLVAGQEQDDGSDEAKSGKARNLKRRIANAISHGLAYNTVIGLAGAAAQAGA